MPASSALNLLCDFLDLSSFLFKTHVFGAHHLKDLFWLCCDICLRQSLPHLLTSLSKMLSTLFYSYSIFQEKGQFFFGRSLPRRCQALLLAHCFHNVPPGKCLPFPLDIRSNRHSSPRFACLRLG